MAISEVQGSAQKNILLGRCPPSILLPALDEMRLESLEARRVLFEPMDKIRRLYFPLIGVVSLVTVLSDGSAVEVATVGNEGIVGIDVFLGEDRSANTRAIVQVPGEALSVDAGRFRAIVEDAPELTEVLKGYTRALLVQAAQAVACNRVHQIVQRCARWLCTTHDRCRSDSFELTQEFLSQMLGTRRASVTEAVAALQGKGAIRYERGRVNVLDRTALEAAACECYEATRNHP